MTENILKQIALDISNANGRAYYVGGFVRDSILNRESKDIDVEVFGIDEKTLVNILEKYGTVNHFGKAYGIYKLDNLDIDFSLPRTERKTGNTHTAFEVSTDKNMDTFTAAKRRDITINALMKDILNDTIIDHFGALADIKKKTIRHIDDETFKEDPLRVLRVARFSAQLNFKIDPKTISLCKDIDISTLSKERILNETNLALMSKKPSRYFKALLQMNKLKPFFNELELLNCIDQDRKYHNENAFKHTMLCIDKAAKLKNLVDKERRLKFMYAVLFHDIGKIEEAVSDLRHDAAGIMIIDDVLNRFTNEKDLHHYVKDMIAFHMRPLVLFENRSSDKKIIRMLDASVYPKDLLFLSEVDIRGRDMAEAKNKGDLFHKWANKVYRMYMDFVRAEHVNGYDLIELGLQGKDIGVALERTRYLEAGISSKRVVLDTIKREFGIKEKEL